MDKADVLYTATVLLKTHILLQHMLYIVPMIMAVVTVILFLFAAGMHEDFVSEVRNVLIVLTVVFFTVVACHIFLPTPDVYAAEYSVDK